MGEAKQMKYYVYISNSKLDMMFPQVPKQFADKMAAELGVNAGVLKASLKARELTETRISKLLVVTQHLESSGLVGDVRSPKAYFKGTLPMRTTLLGVGPEEEVVGDYAAVVFTFSSYAGAKKNKKNIPDYGSVVLVGSYHNKIGMEDIPRKRYTSDTAEIIDTLTNAAERQEKRIAQWEQQVAEWQWDQRRRRESWWYRTFTDEKLDPRKDDPRRGLDLYRGLLGEFVQGFGRKDPELLIYKWPIYYARGPEQSYEFLAKTLLISRGTNESPFVVLGTPIYVAESQPGVPTTEEGSGRSWWARIFGA